MCEYVAEVVRVVGGINPYAIATVEQLDGTVTFSLKEEHGVWKEDKLPLKKQCVILDDIRHHEGKGWRAFSGRFYRPEDEE